MAQILHVEIEQSKKSARSKSEIIASVRTFMYSLRVVTNGLRISQNPREIQSKQLFENVDKITVFVSNMKSYEMFSVRDYIDSARFYVFQLNLDGPCSEEIEETEGSENNVVGSHHWALPNSDFSDLWENLVFDSDIKEKIVNYADAMLKLADKNVNSSIITSNRLVLFHGPPGTGKTSLCKAVAQKLSIRQSHRYKTAQLLEINSHSLFSKWFSESGKLVMKMFGKIKELLEDDETLVFVLIDEVESLTKARESSLSCNEPSDAIRVVNALLTQLDYIRRFPNVLILTTSNLSNAVDDAFLDRADIREFVGMPSENAVYSILYSCIDELKAKHILNGVFISSTPTASAESQTLLTISRECVGFSGRTLRKLPVLAYTLCGAPELLPLPVFFDSLFSAVKQRKNCESTRSADRKKSKSSKPRQRQIIPEPSDSMDDSSSQASGDSVLEIKQEPILEIKLEPEPMN